MDGWNYLRQEVEVDEDVRTPDGGGRGAADLLDSNVEEGSRLSFDGDGPPPLIPEDDDWRGRRLPSWAFIVLGGMCVALGVRSVLIGVELWKREGFLLP